MLCIFANNVAFATKYFSMEWLGLMKKTKFNERKSKKNSHHNRFKLNSLLKMVDVVYSYYSAVARSQYSLFVLYLSIVSIAWLNNNGFILMANFYYQTFYTKMKFFYDYWVCAMRCILQMYACCTAMWSSSRMARCILTFSTHTHTIHLSKKHLMHIIVIVVYVNILVHGPHNNLQPYNFQQKRK